MPAELPPRARLAIASEGILERILNLLSAVHGGLWLGLLERDDLSLITTAAYARSDAYDNIEHNLSGLFNWERKALERHFPPAGRILVPSAGAGRELLGLEELGYQSLGFDPAQSLVDAGQRLLSDKGSQAELYTSLPNQLPSGLTGPFDGVIVGWGGYSHIEGSATRINLLRDLRGLVEEGTPLLVSFALRSPTARRYRVTASIAGAIRRLRRSTQSVELGDTLGGSFDHCFSMDEISSELRAGGFAVVSSTETPYPHAVSRGV